MVQLYSSCAPPAWCHVKYQLAGAGLFFSCLSETELQAGKIILCLNMGMWLQRNKFDSRLYQRLPTWVGRFACSLHTLCLKYRGKLKLALLSWKICGILKYKFIINFSSWCWNHNGQPRNAVFIMVVPKLQTKNELPAYWKQHKERIKLSLPHSINCFKGLSKAESYSGIR